MENFTAFALAVVIVAVVASVAIGIVAHEILTFIRERVIRVAAKQARANRESRTASICAENVAYAVAREVGERRSNGYRAAEK
ncbi:hypothetical protein [Paraburkholderia sp. DHOC27]|uniref:hypothetical protein n=1 Tax=Paraburkholderia sp. DHOC27 TaxID=2303330 RepID=UPI000E3C382C|nr:hypothetical protein [Paraburkholderia sp. DHOC27]RFU49582.1 hypothetical protein D0B32_07300 [Paraburkholderia sp. DHOC27]